MTNTDTTAQIATFLNVAPNAIKSVTEMAWVFCVVVKGCRARFVSKKVVKVEEVKMSDSELAQAVAKAIKATGNQGNVWEKNGMTRVYVKGSGGAGGFIVIEDGELEFRLTGYGQSQTILNAAKSVVAA
jgi:hypothetical protein